MSAPSQVVPRARRPCAASRGSTARPRLFPPGAKGRSYYSNTNYVLLGMLIRAISGRTYGQAVERLANAAGLHSTSYGWPRNGTVGAQGYANPFPAASGSLLERH